MALRVVTTTANIAWTTSGAAAACHPGKQFALLHCTKGANLAAGDTIPAGKLKRFLAVDMEGTVFLEATAGEFDVGDHQFGMFQVADLLFYEFVYAGRRSSEGSCKLNMMGGFSVNPSLDTEPDRGQTVDDVIFDPATVLFDKTTTPGPGFNVTVRFGDHPNNTIPNRFVNRRTGADNFLALAARAQQFTVFFVTRPNKTTPLTILGRFTWAVAWLVEFNWSVATKKATAQVRRAEILPGVFQLGPPSPLDGPSVIATNRSPPSTNKQDKSTADKIFLHRVPSLLEESKTWPDGFRTDFFT